jgi:hypothetical protein
MRAIAEMSKPDAMSIRFRPPLWPQLFILLPGLASGLHIMLVLHIEVGFLIPWIALLVLTCALGRWFGITLTTTDAVLYSLRPRRIPWTSIQAVTQEHVIGTRQVALWTDTGQRIALRAPIVAWPGVGNKQFDKHFHTIGRWWLEHRGADWSPAPPPRYFVAPIS